MAETTQTDGTLTQNRRVDLHGPSTLRLLDGVANASTIVVARRSQVRWHAGAEMAFVEHRAVEPFYFGEYAWSRGASTQVLVVHPFGRYHKSTNTRSMRAAHLSARRSVSPADRATSWIVKAPSSLGRDANGTWSAALRDTKAAIGGFSVC